VTRKKGETRVERAKARRHGFLPGAGCRRAAWETGRGRHLLEFRRFRPQIRSYRQQAPTTVELPGYSAAAEAGVMMPPLLPRRLERHVLLLPCR